MSPVPALPATIDAMPTPSPRPRFARAAGTLCLWGALAGAAWAVLNTFQPNSIGSVVEGNFVILHPLLHRLEHATAALLVFPGVCFGIAAFVSAGLAGGRRVGRPIVAVAALATLAASASSLTEAVVLQWDAADSVRAYALLVLLLLAPLALGAAAVLARSAPLGVRLWPLGLVATLVATGILGPSLGRGEPLAVGVLMLAWAAFGYAVARAAARVPAPTAASGHPAVALSAQPPA